MWLTRLLSALVLAGASGAASGQTPFPAAVPRSDGVAVSPTPTINIDPATKLPAPSDMNGAAFQAETAMTVGASYPAGRSLKVVCTAAGTVTVSYAAGGQGVWAVVVGTQTLPLSVTSVVATSATATFANLY